uniref:Ankyrin repeat-containing protein n=1 Tax=Angiostrongylus cantonensis TaxID=6313 RepID=A0A0K0D4D6_ANGCA
MKYYGYPFLFQEGSYNDLLLASSLIVIFWSILHKISRIKIIFHLIFSLNIYSKEILQKEVLSHVGMVDFCETRKAMWLAGEKYMNNNGDFSVDVCVKASTRN